MYIVGCNILSPTKKNSTVTQQPQDTLHYFHMREWYMKGVKKKKKKYESCRGIATLVVHICNLHGGKELDNRPPPYTHTHASTNTTQQNFCVYNRPHTCNPNTIFVFITHTHTHKTWYNHTFCVYDQQKLHTCVHIPEFRLTMRTEFFPRFGF